MVRLLILLLAALLHLAGTQQVPLAISFVSGSPNSIARPIYSSLRGGRYIYIKAMGFSPDPTQNKVTIGGLTCQIPSDGVTDTFITCVTPDTGSLTNINNAPIVLTSGKVPVSTSYPNSVYFSSGSTPQLTDVYPSAGFANSMVQFYGIHLITNIGDGLRSMGDIQKLALGSDLCSRFDIPQTSISQYSLQYLQCVASSQQQAGKYNVTEQVVYGYAQNNVYMRRTSFANQYYQYSVLPTITSVSPTVGNLGGQNLTITGTGFSAYPSKNSVSVGGVPCQVVSSSNEAITCSLGPTNSTSIPKAISTNGSTTDQANGFLGGAGVNYARYSLSSISSMTNFVLGVRTANVSILGTPQEVGYRADLREGDYYPGSYAQTWNGYFTAPSDGSYTFRGTADDEFRFYLAQNYGTTTLNNDSLINCTNYQLMNQPYSYDFYTAEATVTLAAGKSFYFQAYHINWQGTGFFDLSVTMPNTNNTLSFQKYGVSKIMTNAVVVPEMVTYTMQGGSSGTIQLSLVRVDTSSGAISYNVSANVSYGATSYDFYNVLAKFNSFNGYNYIVNRNIYDANNNTLTNITGAARIDYVVSIYWLRSTSYTNEQFTVKYFGYTGKFKTSPGQSHSPLINGTFTLSIGGNPVAINNLTNIPYNVSASSLQTAIRNLGIPGMSNIEVFLSTNYSCEYGANWTISYKQYNNPVPDIVVNGAGLSGGATTPTIQNLTRRQYSTDLEFDPLDYRFLNTYTNSYGVQVATNGVPAVCLGSCGYTFAKYSEITSISLTGSVLTLNLSDPTTKNFPVNSIKIFVSWLPCTVNTGSTLSNLSCTLTNNEANKPALVAGTLNPYVFISGFGVVSLASGVTAPTIPLNATSITPATGGNNGGYAAVINGSGFPLDPNLLSITLCSQKLTIMYTHNTQISIIIPECNGASPLPITIAVGNITNTQVSFNYTNTGPNTPVIASISPKTSNPGIKSKLTVQGVGFGTSASQLTAYLSNFTGKIYQLSILSVSDTVMVLGLPGSTSGTNTYFLQVTHQTLGDFVPADQISGITNFVYQFSVSSVSPSSGSYNGGTLLNITGVNFATDLTTTQVYIGYTLNWNCKIENITATNILCRTPNISADYTPGVAVDVVVTTRLIILSTCTGTCKFTYNAQNASSNITDISPNTTSGGNITLTGTNFLDSTNTASVSLTLANGTTAYLLPSPGATATSLTFAINTGIASSIYQVRVRNANGESNPVNLTVSWNLGTVSWASGGSTFGNIVNISNGTGYPQSIDGAMYSVAITAASKIYPVTIISCCTNNTIVFAIPPFPSNASLSIGFTGPAGRLSKTYSVSTSYTPTASIVSPLTVNAGSNTISFSATNTITANITAISLVSTLNPANSVAVALWNTTGTGANAITNFTVTLSAGSYRVLVLSVPFGYINITDTINVSISSDAQFAKQQISFNGGQVTLKGTGLSPSSSILVNGFVGTIAKYTSSAVTYNLPPFVTADTQAKFNLAAAAAINTSQFAFISDQNSSVSNASAAFDNLITTIYGSPNAQCWLGVDAGPIQQISLTRIRFAGNPNWTNVANYTLYAVFQGSNDQTNWNTLAIVDQTVHIGWNTLVSNDSTPYRYIRFLHNSTSNCHLAEVQLIGVVLSTVSVPDTTSQLADVTYLDGFNNKTFAGALEFRQDKTGIITNVNPPYGDVFGGYDITLTGTNLDAGVPVIQIDGIPCLVSIKTATSITCTVANRSNTPTIANNFTVTLGSNNAILLDKFLYILRWSDYRTWGVDVPPIDGDLVYIPLGLALYVDQDTPVLQGIVVQGGTLVFSDEKDLTVQAGFIAMNGGTFIAGTEAFPRISKLTFVMYGNYSGAQLPMLGNKGIGCINCKFYMYGKPRLATWTTLAATVKPGDLNLVVSDTIDWQVGEQIVVASTSFVHSEAEQRTITNVNGKNITVNYPFLYQHVSMTQTYGKGDKLVMQAEVGLLTRNIKMMGDNSSVTTRYGSHLMLTGQGNNGLEAQVAYTQFTQCGQPQILGRYCIHFHMAGDIPTSFARGNAVHQSYARVITIHGVSYLLVEQNVGYRVRGHNFFVQDGIQTHNIIRNNLAISSLTVTNMLQTDISVASFWVTNPTNDFYGNRAAGSDFYGIWYEIKANPDGPSATMDVCPMGNPLGYVANNVAHSNIRFGLRIFILAPRLYPCQPVRNDSDPNDPWMYNPSIQAVFSNFTVYKNLEDGVLAEQVGNVVFNNFTVAENYNSGFEFYVANFTKQPPQVTNSVVIGQSTGNANSNTTNYTSGMSALITGRTGVYNFSNINFYNYPVGSIFLQTCRYCDDIDHYTNLGTQVNVKNLTFTNVTGNMLFMIGLKRDVIYDSDCSFCPQFDTISRSRATITYGYNHIASYHQNTCPSPTKPTTWDNAVICDQTITIRRVWFTNLLEVANFRSQSMKVAEIPNVQTVLASNLSLNLYSSVTTRIPSTTMQAKVEKPFTYSLPFITGQIYQVWWGTGIDFTHLSIVTTPNFPNTDNGIVFKFNYSLNRQLFRVGPLRTPKVLTALDYIAESASDIDPTTCANGQYLHNNDNSSLRMLSICQSGKNRTKFQYTDVNPVICFQMCPAPAGTFTKQNFIRLWSNATQWPNGTVPKAGDNVTVNGNWTVKLNVDPAPLNYFVIDGDIIVDDTRNVNITANSIHIRAGSITAGTPTAPFQHNFTIQLNGNKNDTGFYIDPILAGSKYLVVTGKLNLYGIAPSVVSTYLTQSSLKGSSTLYVANSTGWAAGDTLVLSPSFSNYSQFQKVTIQAINTDGSIALAAPLAYTHYGSASITVNSTYGTLDARTNVGHINRNIQIVPGPDAGWGYSVIVYGFLDGDNVTGVLRRGSVQLNGVQFQDGGQLDSLNAPLVFLNNPNNISTSLVTATSFVNCKAHCIYVQNAKNITIDTNVFYNAWVMGIEALSANNINITNNLIIGVYQRPTLTQGSELIACISMYQYPNPATSQVIVQNNSCLGSSQHGFAFPFVGCNQLETNPFANNTVGSANIGYILQTNGQQCQAFSYAKAFACNIGQICGPPGISTIIFSKFVMADNQRAITLKLGDGEGNTNHTAYLYTSYVTAVSRPACAECYGPNATKCSNLQGLRMFTPSANGEQLPNKYGGGFDVICKQPVYDAKSYLINVTFDSFMQSYTGAVSSCGSNFVFKPHSSAFDESGSVNLYNSTCTNCDANSYLLAPAPSPSQLGWNGGCGDILCTGFQNYLIQDFNGSFFGQRGTIVPNNSLIGTNESSCTFSQPMNAYMCQREDFGVLEYQNVAADFNTRIMWPVNLTYDGANYSTITNGWREWDWLGLQPQNKRFGRFLSVVRLNMTYNMTFASKPPEKLQIQLQKRSPNGNNSNYVIVKLKYPLPNSIRITKNGTIIKPVLVTDPGSGAQQALNVSNCGDNYYFYTNYSIHFVVTEAADCLLTVELVDSIQLTTHFSMNISDFYKNSSIGTTFIDRLCALLNIIDTSRVKIVGVFSGSTLVAGTIESSPGATNTQDIQNISILLNTKIGSGDFASVMTKYIAPVLSQSAVYNPLNPDSNNSTDNNSTNNNGTNNNGTNNGTNNNGTVIPSGSGSNQMSAGVIVGIVAGVVVLVGTILTIVVVIRKQQLLTQLASGEEMIETKQGSATQLARKQNLQSNLHPETHDKISGLSQPKIYSQDLNNNIYPVIY